MSKRNKRKAMGRGKAAVMAAVLAAPGLACTAGFNSLEQSVDCEAGAVRTRALNNVAQRVGGAELSYHGANQLNDYDGATYNGVHRFMSRRNGGKVKGLVRVCTAAGTDPRTMAGVRLPNVRGEGGFTDISTDENGANITIFTVDVLGPGRTLDFLHSQNFAYGGKPAGYTEIQYNHGFRPHWQAVVRAEVPNYDVKKGRLML